MFRRSCCKWNRAATDDTSAAHRRGLLAASEPSIAPIGDICLPLRAVAHQSSGGTAPAAENRVTNGVPAQDAAQPCDFDALQPVSSQLHRRSSFEVPQRTRAGVATATYQLTVFSHISSMPLLPHTPASLRKVLFGILHVHQYESYKFKLF